MREQGATTTIVTAQWQSFWPPEIDHFDTPVVRLAQPQLSVWGTFRYMWGLSRWLREHRHQLDAVIVSRLRNDAYAAISALRGTRIPVILRAEGAGELGDAQWLATSRFGSRFAHQCRQADAIVATSSTTLSELQSAAFPAARLHEVASGVPPGDESCLKRKQTARRVLGDLTFELQVESDTPIAIYAGTLHKSRGLLDLLAAWKRIVQAWPDARLWFIGDGPHRDDLWQRAKELDLKYHVAMPGRFDDVSELYHASDVFVAPALEGTASLSILEAMAIGLPVVATDLPDHREALLNGELGLLVPPRNPVELADAIANVFTRQSEAGRRAIAARAFVQTRRSSREMAREYLALAAECISKRGER